MAGNKIPHPSEERLLAGYVATMQQAEGRLWLFAGDECAVPIAPSESELLLMLCLTQQPLTVIVIRRCYETTRLQAQ